MVNNAIRDRAHGVMLGQFAGDALGSSAEFMNLGKVKARWPNGLHKIEGSQVWGTQPGQMTDDSEMATSLADSIIKHGRYEPREAARGYVDWGNSGPFDMGGTTSSALSVHRGALSKNPNYDPLADDVVGRLRQDSQANGVLMRVSPLAIYVAGQRLTDAARRRQAFHLAAQDARLTHPHVVNQHANGIYTAALAAAVRHGLSPEETYQHALDTARLFNVHSDVHKSLIDARNQPMEFEKPHGWVLTAFQRAMHELANTPDFESGVSRAASSACDSDTTGAITGALLGGVHGRQHVPPEWVDVLNRCQPDGKTQIEGTLGRPRPSQFWPRRWQELADDLLEAGRGSRAQLKVKV